MKKLGIIVSIIVLILISSVAMADSSIIIRIDSDPVEFSKDMGEAFIDENSRTQVPFRVTLEKFGASVEWDNENRIAIAEKDGIVVRVPIGENFIYKDESKIPTDTKALIREGRTYLPIRPVIEAFGSSVDWDSELRTVVITTEEMDIEGILLEAYNKLDQWESFESNNLMEVNLILADKLKLVASMPVKLNMKVTMTNFKDPLRGRVEMDSLMDLGSMIPITERSQLYYQVEDGKLVNYTSKLKDGEEVWYKNTAENFLAEEDETIKEEIKPEDHIVKNIKYYGSYRDQEGRRLLRIENTSKFSLYEDYSLRFFDGLLGLEEDLNLGSLISQLDNIKYIVYIDEESGEIVRYNMDLSIIMKPVFEELLGILGDDLVSVSYIDARLDVDIFNIDNAKDFQIPEEALNSLEF